MGDTGDSNKQLSYLTRDTEVLQSYIRVEESKGEKDDEKDGEKVSKGKRREKEEKPPRNVQPIYWQLTKELQSKGKNRSARRYEEMYTDKDRAAAVTIGSRDIKQSLKMKRKAERSKALHIPEETEPGTLLALAEHEIKIGHTEIAFNFVRKALLLNPEDKAALVSRSRCYLLLGDPKKALEDAEAALLMDKMFIKALFQKAEALYHLGDFEHSLMFYHRGLKARPDMVGFRLGVQKAQEAIENIIGDRNTSFYQPAEILKSILGDVHDIDALYEHHLGSKFQTSSRSDIKPKTAIIKKSEKHLLGDLYKDKEYLENLLKQQDVISLKQDFANHDIAKYAKDGIDFLNTRQEFWRQQKANTSTHFPKRTKKPV